MITSASKVAYNEYTASRKPLRVAYILHRFPYLSETFIMREMAHVREHCTALHIFSLLPPKREPVHKQAQQLLAHAHYGPLFSVAVLVAQFRFLFRSPVRYVCSLLRVIWQTWREPMVLLRALILFPRSVAIAGEMEQLGIQHIHAHFVWLEGLAAGVVRDLLEITFSIHPHAFGIFGRNQRDVKCELNNASQVISVSEYHRRYISKLCPTIAPEDVEVVYYGLDPDQICPADEPPRNNVTKIVSVGRLIEKKGFEYLIDACGLLKTRGLSFTCDIVGAGPRHKALQNHIAANGLEQHVRLLGAMTDNQILELYRRADIFALPCVVARDGDRDGLPVVLTEAMACELPVVTTPVTGIPDLVRHGETGLLVEERNSDQLAMALEELMNDEQLRRVLAIAARKIVVRHCDVRRNAERMVEIFQRVALVQHPQHLGGNNVAKSCQQQEQYV